MISGENLDRSLWIGASDTKMVIANPNTKQWHKWWAVKTGLFPGENHFSNRYTNAGNVYEKPIARFFGEDIVEDRTIMLPDYSLRVNLDADIPEGEKKIIECKTFDSKNGKLDGRSSSYKAYYMQVQVQMFAWKMNFGEEISAEIRIYYLNKDDYEAADYGIALPLDPDRIDRRFITYEEPWINGKYLPALMPLARELKKLRD